uniref:Uncharacterized protein n=1 Tax=Anopheles atroparvus TaxID=41427 RepID=A0A182J7P7_ANOAO
MNGFVECEQESCPAVDDCYFYKKKGPDECCDKCIGCLFEGRHIDSGTEWTDPEDPCMHYKCVSGVVTRSEMKCYAPCSDPIPPRKGQCCPTCLGANSRSLWKSEKFSTRIMGNADVYWQGPGKFTREVDEKTETQFVMRHTAHTTPRAPGSLPTKPIDLPVSGKTEQASSVSST